MAEAKAVSGRPDAGGKLRPLAHGQFKLLPVPVRASSMAASNERVALWAAS